MKSRKTLAKGQIQGCCCCVARVVGFQNSNTRRRLVQARSRKAWSSALETSGLGFSEKVSIWNLEPSPGDYNLDNITAMIH